MSKGVPSVVSIASSAAARTSSGRWSAVDASVGAGSGSTDAGDGATVVSIESVASVESGVSIAAGVSITSIAAGASMESGVSKVSCSTGVVVKAAGGARGGGGASGAGGGGGGAGGGAAKETASLSCGGGGGGTADDAASLWGGAGASVDGVGAWPLGLVAVPFEALVEVLDADPLGWRGAAFGFSPLVTGSP